MNFYKDFFSENWSAILMEANWENIKKTKILTKSFLISCIIYYQIHHSFQHIKGNDIYQRHQLPGLSYIAEYKLGWLLAEFLKARHINKKVDVNRSVRVQTDQGEKRFQPDISLFSPDEDKIKAIISIKSDFGYGRPKVQKIIDRECEIGCKLLDNPEKTFYLVVLNAKNWEGDKNKLNWPFDPTNFIICLHKRHLDTLSVKLTNIDLNQIEIELEEYINEPLEPIFEKLLRI